jgi:hypothetical protein
MKNEIKNNKSKDSYYKYSQTTLNIANNSKSAMEIQTSTQTLNIDKSCLIPDVFNEKEEPNFEEASNESEMSNITDKVMSKQVSKPKMSYARLISEALLNSPNGMLILSDIYESISTRHPYYQMNVPGWQNSIRHNLTLNKSFVKCTDGLKKVNDGKYSNYWKLSENLSKSVMKKLSKEELSKIQAFLAKNCYVKSKTSFDLMCKNCYQTFINPYQLNEHSCHAIKQEPQDIMESVIEDSQNDQNMGKDREKRLFQYISTDSETGRESCIFCQKVFSASHPSVRLRHAMDHIDGVHLKIMRCKCQFCGKKYPRMSQLSTHLKLKHPVGSKIDAISEQRVGSKMDAKLPQFASILLPTRCSLIASILLPTGCFNFKCVDNCDMRGYFLPQN